MTTVRSPSEVITPNNKFQTFEQALDFIKKSNVSDQKEINAVLENVFNIRMAAIKKQHNLAEKDCLEKVSGEIIAYSLNAADPKTLRWALNKKPDTYILDSYYLEFAVSYLDERTYVPLDDKQQKESKKDSEIALDKKAQCLDLLLETALSNKSFLDTQASMFYMVATKACKNGCYYYLQFCLAHQKQYGLYPFHAKINFEGLFQNARDFYRNNPTKHLLMKNMLTCIFKSIYTVESSNDMPTTNDKEYAADPMSPLLELFRFSNKDFKQIDKEFFALILSVFSHSYQLQPSLILQKVTELFLSHRFRAHEAKEILDTDEKNQETLATYNEILKRGHKISPDQQEYFKKLKESMSSDEYYKKRAATRNLESGVGYSIRSNNIFFDLMESTDILSLDVNSFDWRMMIAKTEAKKGNPDFVIALLQFLLSSYLLKAQVIEDLIFCVEKREVIDDDKRLIKLYLKTLQSFRDRDDNREKFYADLIYFKELYPQYIPQLIKLFTVLHTKEVELNKIKQLLSSTQANVALMDHKQTDSLAAASVTTRLNIPTQVNMSSAMHSAGMFAAAAGSGAGNVDSTQKALETRYKNTNL